MIKIRSKNVLVGWYYLQLAQSEEHVKLSERDRLEFGLQLHLLLGNSGIDGFESFHLSVFKQAAPSVVPVELRKFVQTASAAIEAAKSFSLRPRQLIALLRDQLPFEGLSVENDYRTYSRYLVSSPEFSNEHQVDIRVRLGWIRDGDGPLYARRDDRAAPVILLDRTRKAAARDKQNAEPYDITTSYDLFLFLRKRLEEAEPRVLVSRRRYKRAQRWADYPVRHHPLHQRRDPAPGDVIGTVAASDADWGEDVKRRKIWCSDALLQFSKMLKYDGRGEVRTSLNRCCRIMIQMLELADDKFLRVDKSLGNYVVSTKKLEAKFGLRVRVAQSRRQPLCF